MLSNVNFCVVIVHPILFSCFNTSNYNSVRIHFKIPPIGCDLLCYTQCCCIIFSSMRSLYFSISSLSRSQSSYIFGFKRFSGGSWTSIISLWRSQYAISNFISFLWSLLISLVRFFIFINISSFQPLPPVLSDPFLVYFLTVLGFLSFLFLGVWYQYSPNSLVPFSQNIQVYL